MKSLRASVPRVLTGISEEQIAQHWRLYEPYIAQVNALRSEPQSLRRESKSGSALYADRRRRFGLEYNGMVLHEFYFGNQKAQAHEPSATSALKEALTAQFGTTRPVVSAVMRVPCTSSLAEG